MSLGCVSAADDVQADANMAIDDSINDEISVMENDNEGVSDSISEEQLGENEPGTFTDLKNDINSAGNYLELTRDYVYNDESDNHIYRGILVKENFLLDGKGHTLDGKNLTMIFYFMKNDDGNPYNTTLKNINFINANDEGDGRGSALGIERGPINIINCTFRDNYNSGTGGAVLDYGSSKFENCTFINNYGSQGGAVYSSWSLFKNCKFINNSAGNGGAVHAFRWDKFDGCLFEGNNATNGAAIMMTQGYIYNCTFKNNTATNNGGGVCFSEMMDIRNTSFIGNKAKVGGGGYFSEASYGPPINSIIDCKFINNTATEYGGGVRFSSSHNVLNTLFENNTAGINGGGAYVGWGNFSNCTFKSNNATENGGGVYSAWNNRDFSIDSSNFIDNSAANGGGLYVNTYTLTNGNTFTNNSATGNGGAAFVNNGTLYNSQFNNNNATDGGAVYLNNGTINGSKFYNNTAVNGAALYAIEGTVYNSQFVENVAEVSGGAISVENPMVVTNVEFNMNIANGVISDFDPGTPIKITIDSVITANAASYVINDGGDYSVYLKDFNGLPILGAAVSFVFNGVELGSVTIDDTGLAKITLTPDILKAATVGSRDLVVSYAGDDYFNPVTKTVAINVKKETLNVVANAASYVINYGGYYSVTVKDSKNNLFTGKTMTFYLNGKKIGTATTDANGVAKIKLTASILKAAKYGTKNLVIKYDDALYTASKTVKITIKKEKTKFTAYKKTFRRALKIKKYSVILKNSKGKVLKKVRVYLRVKGKTFKATTNTKGKAIFKITNLKKRGRFLAKITYKGNAYYLKTTKKVYLRVK